MDSLLRINQNPSAGQVTKMLHTFVETNIRFTPTANKKFEKQGQNCPFFVLLSHTLFGLLAFLCKEGFKISLTDLKRLQIKKEI